MPVTASPLRYPGGKTVYANMMTEIIEINNLRSKTFVEAFAGGAGAAITMLLRGDIQSIILNDFDKAIYALWYSILNETDLFLQHLRDIPITVDEWHIQRDIYRNEREDLLSLGFATFYLNRANRAGILAANPIGGLQQDGKYHINARFNKINLEKKIQAIANHRDKITLYNLDAINFINSLEEEYRNERLFIYFDPPYYIKGKQLYLNFYNNEDHIKLSLKIKKSPFPWVLSYDNVPQILNLYTDIPAYRKDLSYSIGPPSKTKELIISNLQMPKYLEQVMEQ